MDPAKMVLTKGSSYLMIVTCLAGIYEMTKPSHTSAPHTKFYQMELTWRFEIWVKCFLNEKKMFYHVACIHIEWIWSKNEQVNMQGL